MTLKPQNQTQTRRLSACHRHPAEPVTGFCASCLRERLAGLDPSGQPEPSSSSSATAFVSSLKHSGGGGDSMTSLRCKAAVPSSSFPPELLRSKSFSTGKCEALSGSSEPRRKSCDVRVRNTLAHLFDLDDEKNGLNRELQVESKNLGFSRVAGTVFESREGDGNGDEIRVSEDVLVPNVNVDGEVEEELKTMKEHIDLEWQSRKHTARDLRDIAGSFWVAASVFSKKLRKWRQKQKMKKHGDGGSNGGGVGCNGGDLLAMRDSSIGGPFRETQSEIAEYGFGRRSCDTEPRFSVDAGRMSLDDSRFSFDEARASWDGYLIARTIPRLTPMLSVVENVMLAPVNRSDNNRISIQEQIINEDEGSGGSAQTRDDYSDSSSSQRRSSFDRSSSVKSFNKKTSGLEADEVKSISNARVSPATVDIFRGTKLVITERELKDWHLNSLKDDQSESFESSSKAATSTASGGNLDGFKKSSRWRKVCNPWGFIHRRSDKKYENVIDCPVSEAHEKQDRKADEVVKGDSSGKLIRSSSCVSSRNSNSLGFYHSVRSVAETRDDAKKCREELALERNRSAEYSPSNFDNGLLRFYLTPLRSYRRSKSGKSRLQNSHSIARNVLRLN